MSEFAFSSRGQELRCLNTLFACFTGSVSDAISARQGCGTQIKRSLNFVIKWITKLGFVVKIT